ncbi:hypothetical protein L596_018784 [Steinernema carpocapsae]|uniref:Uncharacterized protein n=1 Tax=Steinernema carpocapsae TaxID=34508 RepID=A0A4U5N5W3_STECR|nr:hypothetical protein L596_018784 [Steinernema carpocapsae]
MERIQFCSKPGKISNLEPKAAKRRLETPELNPETAPVTEPAPEPIESESSVDLVAEINQMSTQRQHLLRKIHDLRKTHKDAQRDIRRMQEYSNEAIELTECDTGHMQRHVIENLHLSTHLQELMEMDGQKTIILNTLNEKLKQYDGFAHCSIDDKEHGELALELKELLREEDAGDGLEPVEPLRIQCEDMCPTEVIQDSAEEQKTLLANSPRNQPE